MRPIVCCGCGYQATITLQASHHGTNTSHGPPSAASVSPPHRQAPCHPVNRTLSGHDATGQVSNSKTTRVYVGPFHLAPLVIFRTFHPFLVCVRALMSRLGDHRTTSSAIFLTPNIPS